MTTLHEDLEARREEFDAHFALAKALEDRMMVEVDASIGSINLSARHINTVKSGLIIHLYNVEEAIMTQVLDFLGKALGDVEPRSWTKHSLREWLRESVASRISESGEDSRLETIFGSSHDLLNKAKLGARRLKKPTGTWDDKGIATFANRMNVDFKMPAELWKRIAAIPEYGDKSPMQFLAERRNAIAHGRRTFEDGASDLGLTQIRRLADTTLDYMSFSVSAFTKHIENKAHLEPSA